MYFLEISVKPVIGNIGVIEDVRGIGGVSITPSPSMKETPYVCFAIIPSLYLYTFVSLHPLYLGVNEFPGSPQKTSYINLLILFKTPIRKRLKERRSIYKIFRFHKLIFSIYAVLITILLFFSKRFS